MKPSSLSKLILVIFALSVAVTYPAQAATIEVPCNTESLVNAINTANGTPEADTLNLTANCTYSFASANDTDGTVGNSALPRITTPITINGMDTTITRSGGPSFRLFYVTGGTLALYNISLSGGSMAGGIGGGGIRNNGGTVIATYTTIEANSAAFGGAIYNYNGGELSVISSTLKGNNATSGNGGGIRNQGGTVTVIDSTLESNYAYEDGGGIYNSNNGTVTVTHSTVSGNRAIDGAGGGIYNSSGTVMVTNSTFTGNYTDFSPGGGIHNHTGGTVTVTNSIVSGNRVIDAQGGGINNFGTATVTNSILSGNNADGPGGGIYNDGFYGNGTLTVTNSIIWGNSTQIAGTVSVTHSIVHGGYAGEGNLSDDPLFIEPIPYASAPTALGNYQLRFGSPALDAGSLAALPPDNADVDGDGNIVELLPYDIDSTARVKGGLVDMGAYEGAGTELLTNGGFEVDADEDKIPDGWAVKNAAGDKLKCNKPDKTFSNTGVCASMFKGGLDERTKLIQNVSIDGATFAANDRLILSAFFSGGNAAVKAKFIVKAAYTGGTVDKQSITVGPHGAYTEVVVPDLVLTSGAVEQVKVMLKHKSAAGKLLVDTASLRHAPPASATRSDILPPPPAPDGFRGGN